MLKEKDFEVYSVMSISLQFYKIIHNYKHNYFVD
mgnify:CR=1 FL=1